MGQLVARLGFVLSVAPLKQDVLAEVGGCSGGWGCGWCPRAAGGGGARLFRVFSGVLLLSVCPSQAACLCLAGPHTAASRQLWRACGVTGCAVVAPPQAAQYGSQVLVAHEDDAFQVRGAAFPPSFWFVMHGGRRQWHSGGGCLPGCSGGPALAGQDVGGRGQLPCRARAALRTAPSPGPSLLPAGLVGGRRWWRSGSR